MEWNKKIRINERELKNWLISNLQIDEKTINGHIKYYKDQQSMHYHIYQETQGFIDNDSINDLSTLRASKNFDLIIWDNYFKLEISARKAFWYLLD